MEFAILKTMKRIYVYIYKHAILHTELKYVHINTLNTARLYLGFQFWGESISQKSEMLSTEEGTFNTNAVYNFAIKGGWDSAPTFFKSLGASSPIERLYWKYIHSKAGENSHVMHQYDKNLHLLSYIEMCYTMRQLYNSSLDHENKSFFDILLKPFGISWEEKKYESLFQYIEYSKIQSNIYLTNTSKYHNITYKWPEYFI